MAGLLADDSNLLRAAVGTLRAGPRPLLVAAALSDLGASLARAGRTADAVVAYEETADISLRFGAFAGAAAASTALERLGVRRRTAAAGGNERAVAGWTSLTDSEVLVAKLVSAGHSNRSAAMELGISPNTVGTHLRSTFGKLGVRSRVQLSNVVHEHS